MPLYWDNFMGTSYDVFTSMVRRSLPYGYHRRSFIWGIMGVFLNLINKKRLLTANNCKKNTCKEKMFRV